MSNTRVVIRKEVNRLLSGGRITASTVTTAGAGTGLTVIDTGFKSTLLDNYPFTGDILLITSGAVAGLWRRIASFAATSGTFTVDDAFTFTADGTGVTITATTLTDARQAWTVNSFVGYVITCATRTMTVTSNTATVLTGASWAASDPSDGNAYSCVGAIASGVTYEMFHVLHPSRIEECIDRSLRKMLYDTIAIPSFMSDGDMEANSTTSWTAGAGATLTKATPVLRGMQALKVAGDATCGVDLDGYAYQQINVVEGDSYFVWAACKNEDTSTSCKLIAYDVTNSAEIDSETSAQVAYVGLGFSFQPPSGCKQIQIQLLTLTSSKYSMWDHVQLLRKAERDYLLPNTWVNETWQVGRTVYQLEGANLAGDTRQLFEYPAVEWPHISVKKWSAIDVAITPDPPFNNDAPVYIRCLRHYSALTADSSTTDADLDWVVAKTLFECYDLLDNPLTPSDERALFSVEKDKWAHRATAFGALFEPLPTGNWGLGGETLFRVAS